MLRRFTLYVTSVVVLFLSATLAKGQCPPPSCPVGNCYCISDNTVTDERGTLYDDGGPGNDYLDGATTGTQVNSYLFNIEPASDPDTIALQFTSFAMEPSAACEYDHIEILDGGVSKGIYCGSDNPGVVICTSGSVTIRWFSDPNTVAAGFEMLWFTDSVPPAGPTGGGGYCQAKSDDCGGGMGIYDVEMTGDNGGFTNQTSITDCENNNGYTDFSSTHIAYLTVGEAYTLTALSNDNGYFLGQFSVFVDWNSDFDFDDPGEMVYTGSTSTAGDNAPSVVAITPPNGTAPSVKRMRLRSCSCTPPLPACGTYNLGEVEDYALVVGDPVFCATTPSPADAATDVCQKGLTLSWYSNTAGGRPDGYRVSLGSNNPPNNVINNVDVGTDTTLEVTTDLSVNTSYFWTVTAYNSDGDAIGCDTWSFTTGADPGVEAIHARASVDTVFSCLGSSEVLFASVSGGSGSNSYLWTGNTALLDVDNKDSVLFTGVSVENNTYHVRVEDARGCFGVDSIVMSSVPNADAGTISGVTELCSYDQLDLSTDGFNGNLQWEVNGGSNWTQISGANSDSYSSGVFNDAEMYRLIANTEHCSDTSNVLSLTAYPLSAAPTLSSNTGSLEFCAGDEVILISDVEDDVFWNDGTNNDSLIVSAGGIYSARYLDANSCSSAVATATVIENSLPSKPLIDEDSGADTLNLCDELSHNLNTQASGLLEWNGDPAEDGQSYSIVSSGKHWVTLTDAKGCTSTSDTLEVALRAHPAQPTVQSGSSDNSFCSGESLELSSDYSGSVYWNGDVQVNSATLTVSTGGDNYVTAVNEYGCETESETITVTENPAPIKPVVASVDGSEGFCEGDSLQLTATSADPYYWNGDTDINSAEIYAKAGGDYFVTAFNTLGCENSSDMFEVTAFENPEVPVVTNDGADLVSSVTSGEFQWYMNDGTPVDGETEFRFEDAPDGSYYVVVTDPNTGCSSQSDFFVGIQAYELGSFNLFPNPVQNGQFITVAGENDVEAVIILDATGKRLNESNGNKILIKNLSSGLYFVNVRINEEERVAGRISVE